MSLKRVPFLHVDLFAVKGTGEGGPSLGSHDDAGPAHCTHWLQLQEVAP